jgi:hypothetical protein
MTDVIKPFVILNTKQEPGGSTGVYFQAEKVEMPEPLKRRRLGVQSYISVPAGKDIDQAVFEHLQNSGWL